MFLPSEGMIVNVKIIGNQWYWSYGLPVENVVADPTNKDVGIVEDTLYDSFDSCFVLEEGLLCGQLRLLEVDKRLILPKNVPVQLLITSHDVIHS